MKIIEILLVATSVLAHCPKERIKNNGDCSFVMDCFHTVTFQLPAECQDTTDYPVLVDITLYDPAVSMDAETDTNSLETITTLRISGQSKSLTFLDNMPRLKYLYLVNNNITEVNEKPFYHLNRLEILNLSYNNLHNIMYLLKFEGKDNMLKKLNLKNNNIHNVNKDDFEELTALNELDLSYNKIEEIPPETFVNLHNLQILNMNYNYINYLNGALNDLKNLKHLFLKGNQLDAIDVDVELKKNNYHLQTFDISGNKINELKPTVFWRHWLHFDGNSVCKINLSENNINSVPNASALTFTERLSERSTRHLGNKYNVDVVTELDLSKNYIENIGFNAFQDIEKLVTLDLSTNNIALFEVNADHLANIKRLNLSDNDLTYLLFETFSNMTQLENLDVSHNDLSHIDDNIFQNNHNLKFVNFTFNKIKEVRYLKLTFHPGVGNLDFSNNELSRMVVGHELRLARLFLQSNKITDLSLIDLSRQTGLQFLQVSHNYIQHLNESSVKLPQSLVYLDLSFNDINSISPSAFASLNNLVSLSLGNNRLQSLEFGTFQGLNSLRNLDLSYNIFKKFNSKVLIDLKMLQILYLKYNQIVSFDYSVWISHKFDVKVYIDGNNLSCEWLSVALKNFYRGYSRMKPSTNVQKITGKSVDGIPCKSTEELMGKHIDVQDKNCDSHSGLADERLLMINKKILEAIKDQTFYVKQILSQITHNKN